MRGDSFSSAPCHRNQSQVSPVTGNGFFHGNKLKREVSVRCCDVGGVSECGPIGPSPKCHRNPSQVKCYHLKLLLSQKQIGIERFPTETFYLFNPTPAHEGSYYGVFGPLDICRCNLLTAEHSWQHPAIQRSPDHSWVARTQHSHPYTSQSCIKILYFGPNKNNPWRLP